MADNTRAGEQKKGNWMSRLIARARAKGKNWRWSQKLRRFDIPQNPTVSIQNRRGRDNLSVVVVDQDRRTPLRDGPDNISDPRDHVFDNSSCHSPVTSLDGSLGLTPGLTPGLTSDESPDESFSSDNSDEPLTPHTVDWVSNEDKPNSTSVRVVAHLDSVLQSSEDIHVSGLSSESTTTVMHDVTFSPNAADDKSNHGPSDSTSSNSSSSEEDDDGAFDKEPRHVNWEEPLSPTSFFIDGNEDRADNSFIHSASPKDRQIQSIEDGHTHSSFTPETAAIQDNVVSLLNPPDDGDVDSVSDSSLDVPSSAHQDNARHIYATTKFGTHEGTFGPLPFQPDLTGKMTKVDLASLRLHAVDHSRIRQDADFPPSSSLLENMPSEMRLQILLHMPDLQTLSSLVHASPRMHKDYVGTYDRPKILAACLQREINDFFPDAYAVLMSQACEIGERVEGEDVDRFLHRKYQHWHDNPVAQLDDPHPLPDGVHSLRLEQRLWLYTFHLHLVRPLTFRYCHWALDNIWEAVRHQDTEQGESKHVSSKTSRNHGLFASNEKRRSPCDVLLSRKEQTRIHRAFYRTQVFNQLWGQRLDPYDLGSPGGVHFGDYSEYWANCNFFGIFEPWDVDAIASIDLFLRDQYTLIFKEVRDHFQPTHPRFKNAEIQHHDGYEELDGTFVEGYDAPVGSADLSIEGREDFGNHFNCYMNGTISCGLFVTLRLFASRDYEELCGNAERCLIWEDHTDPIMGDVLERDPQRLDWRIEAALKEDSSDDSDDECEDSDNDAEDSDNDSEDSDTDSEDSGVGDSLLSRDKVMMRRDPLNFLGDSVSCNTPPLGWVLLWGGRYFNLWGAYTPEGVKRLGHVIWDKRRWDDMEVKDIVAKQWETADPVLKDELKDKFSWTPIT
ncbi:hypothetical protein F5Y18DRAFT_400024, partial [Xylariaceae sp. FL1019]